jgi:hypothetical protein
MIGRNPEADQPQRRENLALGVEAVLLEHPRQQKPLLLLNAGTSSVAKKSARGGCSEAPLRFKSFKAYCRNHPGDFNLPMFMRTFFAMTKRAVGKVQRRDRQLCSRRS